MVVEGCCSVLVAVVVCAVWCVVGCCGLVDNDIGDEGCAALARALEGGAVPELSKLVLACMYFGVIVLEGLWCERSAACV